MLSAIHSYSDKVKALPRALTSYDLLKSLALVLMFVDHLGVGFGLLGAYPCRFGFS